ncbi:MAG TPA: GDSL-type esterase/lipase family protein [Chitinophagaceae bacterium]
MKSTTACLLLLVLSLFTQSYGQTKADTLFASALKPIGRYVREAKQLELISSAVHFGFSFKGTAFILYASIPDKNGHNYLQYELDGVYQKRIRIEGSSDAPIVIKVATPDMHTVWIYKATEAHTGPVMIAKIVADNTRPLAVPRRPLIEFIGNSITCGAAADTSETPCGVGVYHDQHNAYMAYGPRVARALGVNFILSSVSGIGIYRTWNMDGPAMPAVYEKTDFHAESTRNWDFNTYNPRVVSIALGTNDLSHGDGKTPRKPFDPDVFNDSYLQFIRLVKSKYPKARIALLSSPMENGSDAMVLGKCLETIKQKADAAYPADKPVEIFYFKPMHGGGCGGHPSVEDHAILAEQLEPFFKKLLQ